MKTKLKYIYLFIGSILLVWFALCLPNPLFNKGYSTILETETGELLSARIADDEQWRFPLGDSIPEKFHTCITQFEDAYFPYHFGVNPISIAKATAQNLEAGEVVRGGSTLTMQVIRLALGNKERTVWQKVKEMILAVRLECTYSKEEILSLYAAHAPFGGNVVGLEAASWRYYGRNPHQLSWSEMAALAVLPNSPALIHPGIADNQLLVKRNRLLKKLWKEEIISQTDFELALLEPLPGKPKALPQKAHHLLDYALKQGKTGQRISVSLDSYLQRRVQRLVNRFQQDYSANNVRHAAVMIREVASGKVVAYVGNGTANFPQKGQQVDVIQAPRSTGSILKPFLYSAAMEEGVILPHSLLPDVPTQISGYAPRNFHLGYDGAVTASSALTRSLNIPFVRLLQQYGVPKFLNRLKGLGFTSIRNSADHYGLSLILGGAECTLWELSAAYGSLAQALLEKGALKQGQWVFLDEERPKAIDQQFSSGTVWQTVQAMAALNRPREEEGWEYYTGSRKIAWKTGTSFGFRDAWAVGITPEYVVSVWVGNANGEGRNGLTGASKAGPILFQAFDLLPSTSWFQKPIRDLHYANTCAVSGFLASQDCPKDTLLVQEQGERVKQCTFHQNIQTDASGVHRVYANCYPLEQMKEESYFVLPASWAYFYKKSHPNYRDLPNELDGCGQQNQNLISMIYPNPNAVLFLPKAEDNRLQEAIFQAAHTNSSATLFWHLDDEFLGTTYGMHSYPIVCDQGEHSLFIQDDQGNSFSMQFEIASR